MGFVLLLIAVLSIGYVTGVWTAVLVVRQSQAAYEDGSPEPVAGRAPDPRPGAGRALELEA